MCGLERFSCCRPARAQEHLYPLPSTPPTVLKLCFATPCATFVLIYVCARSNAYIAAYFAYVRKERAYVKSVIKLRRKKQSTR